MTQENSQVIRKQKNVGILFNMFIVDIQRIHNIFGALLFILKIWKGEQGFMVKDSKGGVNNLSW